MFNNIIFTPLVPLLLVSTWCSMSGHLEHKVRYLPHTLYQIISKYIKILNLKNETMKLSKKSKNFSYVLQVQKSQVWCKIPKS